MQPVSLIKAGAFVCVLCLYAQDAPSPASQAPRPEPPKAEGIPPRTAPTDYQAHGQAGPLSIGAEFTGHEVATPESVLHADDYVAVEVGIYGPPGAHATISTANFTLRVNGKKPLPAQPYGLVVGNLKDPELMPTAEEQKSKTTVGSSGTQTDSSPPPPYRVPDALKHEYFQRLQKLSLPEGDRALPQAGLIYFTYHGKTDKIDSLKLTFADAGGHVTLSLQ